MILSTKLNFMLVFMISLQCYPANSSVEDRQRCRKSNCPTGPCPSIRIVNEDLAQDSNTFLCSIQKYCDLSCEGIFGRAVEEEDGPVEDDVGENGAQPADTWGTGQIFDFDEDEGESGGENES